MAITTETIKADRGALPYDASGVRIQAPSRIVTEDAAGTPVVSPKTSVGTTPQAFTVPDNAVYFIFSATAAAYYGDNATLDGTGTGKGYKKVAANTDARVACAGMDSVYVRAVSSTVDVDFMFEMVGS